MSHSPPCSPSPRDRTQTQAVNINISETEHEKLSRIKFQKHSTTSLAVESSSSSSVLARFLQLKAFMILAQTISACSTSACKQDDPRQLADSSRPDQHVGQLTFPISAISPVRRMVAARPESATKKQRIFVA
ncbi:hypothetical protein Bca4012_044728 [Brassica carinata]